MGKACLLDADHLSLRFSITNTKKDEAKYQRICTIKIQKKDSKHDRLDSEKHRKPFLIHYYKPRTKQTFGTKSRNAKSPDFGHQNNKSLNEQDIEVDLEQQKFFFFINHSKKGSFVGKKLLFSSF